ncbi:uncharacterized protein [Antedon mediterranea]|uniref:uncharacterized protein n=1 Tax=Antedon mediterranea TaxID=105859 RepID=UPI003AF886C0
MGCCGSSKSTRVLTSEIPPPDIKENNKAGENTEYPKENKTLQIEQVNKATHSEDADVTGDARNDGRQLTRYSDACKAFPRPEPQIVTKYDLDRFFSPEHKAIYPGFEAVERLDQHVDKAPKSLKKNIKNLVDYLVESTSSEYDKARVIIRWVATNIAYDVDFLTTNQHRGSSHHQDVLNQGSAVCDGFSNLVLEMCRLCDLTCEKITGIAKGAGYRIGNDLVNGEKSKKFRHAWNRIRISNTWFLCDATWAAGYAEKINDKYRYVFQWNEDYFLTPPETLRHSHKPDDSALAMVDDPISDVHKWTNQALVKPSCCLYKSTHKMTYRHTLIDEATEQHVQNSIALIENEKKATLLLRLPRAGLYRVVLFGEPVCLSDRSKAESRDMLVSFIVHATCVTGSQLFPEFTHFLGTVPAFTEGGFKSTVTHSIIETLDGYTKFTIDRPGCEPIRFNFRDENGNDLTEYVFADSYPGKIVFNVRCPTIGEYSLILFARLSKEHVSTDRYETGATYLILNKNATPLPPYLPFQHWGPNEKFDAFEILLNTTKGSEIVCNKNETLFEISYNKEEVNVLYSMKTKENKTENKLVYAETHRQGQTVRLKFRFRVDAIGFYEFNLFAGKPDTKTNDFIGRWLINVVNPYEGNMFTFNKNVAWGPSTSKMTANNLHVISPTSSTIYQKDEKPDLVIASTSKRRTGIIFNLKNSSGTDINDCVVADSVQQNDETILYTFKFHLSESGFSCIDLFGASGDFIGSWLVDAIKPHSLPLPSNGKRPWGPVQTFFDYGFSVIQPTSSIMSISLDTNTTLTLTANAHGQIHGRLNFHNQEEDIKDGFNIAYSTEDNHKKIVITFTLSSIGYYKFSLFIRNKEKGKFDYGGGWLLHCI